jgi:hypothetical protein
MDIDRWMGSYKVCSFKWIDNKRIYFNVCYYAPGQAISKPPAWDKTVYIQDNPAGQRLVNEFMDSLIQYIERMTIPENCEVNITA